MADQLLSDEMIANLFLKQVMGESMSAAEQRFLGKWLSVSSYNRSIWEDVCTDKKLQSDLRYAWKHDSTQCWNIIISYRAALHNDMPPREISGKELYGPFREFSVFENQKTEFY